MTTGDWIASAIGLATVLIGGIALWHSMKVDAVQQQNRLQDRIWELEDQLRGRHDDD